MCTTYEILFSLSCCFISFQAANYLDVKRLMDLLCARVADLIKGKDPAKIRKTFHVPEPS